MFSGRLSGLAASQLMVAFSPARRLVGEALHLMVGGVALAALAAPGSGALLNEGRMGGSKGASLTSITSTPSPILISSSEVRIMAVALFGRTWSTIMSPNVRRGRLESSPVGRFCGCTGVSSYSLALRERPALGS